ncbi:dihydropteroate synthase [Helicobacter himalayensis]|uniref:dihydropteroate synthase n=1 Tax=Helicobacter himalayensis TaxID=1591088 RepID=UPI0008367B02|nr:dihydropteroate synthase [Helicobacter himalayensis]
MNVLSLCPTHAQNALKRIGAEKMGEKIMSKKIEMLYFEVRDLSHIASAILKQEALSVGAEYASPREQILYKGEKIGLLFGSKTNLARLSQKLTKQSFGLKELAQVLQSHLKPKVFCTLKDILSHTQDLAQDLTTYENLKKQACQNIMAILNVTPDSFYEGSRKNSQQAIERVYELLELGVKFIDIGAASSRPGSETIESSTEITRLKEICTEIKSQNLYKHALFSIDTYNPQTAAFALDSHFSIINDVSGFKHKDMARINASFGAIALLMHSKGTPKNMQQKTRYENLFSEIDAFFTQKIEEILSVGGKKIILDIGFGFAKTKEQNLALVSHLNHFKHFGYPLLLGASRKSTLGELTNKDAQNRLSATLALHLLGMQNGAEILRVHDEMEHIDALCVHYALKNNHLQGLI